MNMSMKTLSIAVCLFTCLGTASAQSGELNTTERQQTERKQLPREVPNPEKIATQMTDRMKESLQLNEKQYKKIYKLNLKEQKERFTNSQNSDQRRPPMRGEGPEMGGQRSPRSEGRPPVMGNGSFPDQMNPPSQTRGDSGNNQAESLQKAAEAKEKKIKKILSTSQYEKWQTEQATQRNRFSKH